MSESGDRSDPDEVQPGDESTVYPDPVHRRQELAAAEKRVAGQIDPGMRAVVVAAVVVVVAVSFSLPHNGGANGGYVHEDGVRAGSE
ncbi:hypothetical protein [Rhodococcus pyridinivorans]|uniref:hypothetical protein n=1 Tax=Rhodococcus pyridinivorans TaxID=103816 RepID=UPI001D1515D1|nr:hypothetical protein [Rhodococcus pyridinivorans]